MKKLKIGLVFIICITTCFIFSACSTNPVYYSKKEIEKYVKDYYGDDYKLVDKAKHLDERFEKSDRKIYKFEYIFENSEGDRFSVFSRTRHTPGLDGTVTIFYEKDRYDNYFQDYIEKHKAEIIKVLEEQGLDYEFEMRETFGGLYTFNVTMKDFSQLSAVSIAAEKIDDILKFNILKNARKDIYMGVDFEITPKREWSTGGFSEFRNSIYFSVTQQEQLKSYEVYATVQAAIVKEIKYDMEECYKENHYIPSGYNVPEEILPTYPPDKIPLVSIGDVDLTEHPLLFYGYPQEYVLYRDGLTNNYLFRHLGLKENPFSQFKDIVNILGGNIEQNGDTVTWVLDGHTYIANYKEPEVIESGVVTTAYDVTCDGVPIELSEVKYISHKNNFCTANGTQNNDGLDNRYFTVEDVEKLLNVDVIIDQKTMTAKIVKKAP